MNSHPSTQVFKTGTLVKVNMSTMHKNVYRFGVAILIKNEFLIIFKNGHIVKRFDPYHLLIEYICATYLSDESFKSIEDIPISIWTIL